MVPKVTSQKRSSLHPLRAALHGFTEVAHAHTHWVLRDLYNVLKPTA